MEKCLSIPRPSKKEVSNYLVLWDSFEKYILQESSLKKLFTKTYPLNNDLDDVLIKVCALNDFYGTNIFSPFSVAKHIIDLKIDKNLLEGDETIVNKIALVEMEGKKMKNFYSFATKYCSHHNPIVYPIYDSYVKKILLHFKKIDKFDTFSTEDLKSYPRFREILINFRKYYNLELFNLKQIDKYLWQAGKEYFPNKYNTKISVK